MGALHLLVCELLNEYLNSYQFHVLASWIPWKGYAFVKGNVGSALAAKATHLALTSISRDFC